MDDMKLMDNNIAELPLVSGDANILNGIERYVVPLYQRAFAWGTGRKLRQNEIIQLMDDVMGYDGDCYHLGSLIVSRRSENEYEVIDGQQRLTALFLIFSQLGLEVKKDCLSYICRQSAEMALSKIANGTFTYDDGVDDKDPACGIYAGVNAIRQKIVNENARLKGQGNIEYVSLLSEKLKTVVLYRVVVPENTDLNRYFEIMNTRGEQLEQQDIVKATLMSNLDNSAERSAFAMIWDACSDMDGYCQMHFHNMNQRNKIFGGEWFVVPQFNSPELFLLELSNAPCEAKDDIQQISFKALVENPVERKDESIDDVPISRFEGIIDFPHFLLHVLNIFQGKTEGSLDDKNLINVFKDAIPSVQREKSGFSRKFIWCLLKCRYLFDRYFIKRETVNGSDGWSLKELIRCDSSASYRGTTFCANDVADGNDELKMIQACLRVSYLAPKSMHWITHLLKFLYSSGEISRASLLDEAITIARNEVRKFLNTQGCECQGVATPHLILNYLDFLLWKNNKNEKYHVDIEGFEFEYRSSVEHWYPQHPTSAETWDDVDRFGNLCILRSDINSKFSNLLPLSKQKNQEKYLNLKHQSLKLRIMADLTEKNDKWDHTICQDHEQKMLELLRMDADL